MKIRNKLKPKVVNEIIELRDSREDVLNFMTNFLENVGLRYNFIHDLLKDYKAKEQKSNQNIKIASGLYLSSLVTCWETFLKDVVVFLVEVDENAKENVKKFLIEKQITEEELQKHGISLGEFITKQFNFQNLSDATEAFNFLFNDNKANITEYIYTTMSGDIIFSSPNFILYWMQQKEDVSANLEEILLKVFSIRHKVVHDANFIFDIDAEFMTKAEDCFILFPQFISIWLSERYNQKRSVINKENKTLRLTEKPDKDEMLFVFSRQDFEAEYEIVDD